jgi:hypothetical protein
MQRLLAPQEQLPCLMTIAAMYADNSCSPRHRNPGSGAPARACTSCGPASLRKVALVCAAHARASSVLPVPGGPYSSTPLGGRMPSALKRSCAPHQAAPHQATIMGRPDAQRLEALLRADLRSA